MDSSRMWGTKHRVPASLFKLGTMPSTSDSSGASSPEAQLIVHLFECYLLVDIDTRILSAYGVSGLADSYTSQIEFPVI